MKTKENPSRQPPTLRKMTHLLAGEGSSKSVSITKPQKSKGELEYRHIRETESFPKSVQDISKYMPKSELDIRSLINLKNKIISPNYSAGTRFTYILYVSALKEN